MKTKEIKGITLITLAVTIVVLLILAGISINTVVGDNGIIKKAQSSAELTKESEAKEIINRTIMEFYLTNEYETLEDFLNTKVSEGRIDKVEKNADGTLKVWKNDYSVTTENKTNSLNNNDNNMNKRIKISITPYEGIYDSCEHEAITNVNVEPTDTTLEYSTDGINYSTTIPKIINAGTATIKIRASKENYETKNLTVIAKIEKAEGNLSLSETSGTINYPNSTTFTVSGNTGTLSVSSSNTNVATVSISGSTVTVKSVGTGIATITVKSAASTNYNEKAAIYTVTVKDPTFTEDSGIGLYADTDAMCKIQFNELNDVEQMPLIVFDKTERDEIGFYDAIEIYNKLPILNKQKDIEDEFAIELQFKALGEKELVYGTQIDYKTGVGSERREVWKVGDKYVTYKYSNVGRRELVTEGIEKDKAINEIRAMSNFIGRIGHKVTEYHSIEEREKLVK